MTTWDQRPAVLAGLIGSGIQASARRRCTSARGRSRASAVYQLIDLGQPRPRCRGAAGHC